jgi:hypothetical protein
VLSASIPKHYFESIAAALSLFLVADGQDSTHASSISITILQSNSAALLKHVDMSSNNFIALYRTINHVPGGTNTTEEFGTLRGAVKRHIESTFVTAWDTYLQRQRDNGLSLALKKKSKEVIQTQATEEAAMEIDAELPASRQQLQDLIQREAKELSRSMIQKEVTMQVKHALKKLQGGNPRRLPQQRKHDKRKEMDQTPEAPEAQRTLDRPKPEQTPSPILGPTTETTRLHRVATVPTGTSEMANKTVATTASHSNRRNAISSRDIRTVEETTGQAHQTPLLVENTAGVELHACVPD